MAPYFGIGPRPGFQFDHATGKIFAIGRLDASGGVLPLGTGFLLNKKNHLATAAHVTGYDDSGLVMVLNAPQSIHEYQPAERQGLHVLPLKFVAHNPIHDLAVLEVQSDEEAFWDMNLSGADGIRVGSNIITLGYPHLNTGRCVLTYNEASVGAKVLLTSMGGQVKSLILNLLSRPGQSGSPVFSADKTDLVGVLTGAYLPEQGGGLMISGTDIAALHQTTHVVSAEYLKGMY